MKNRIMVIITVLFFGVMIFLSLFAKKIHDSTLPCVTVSRPEMRVFEEVEIDENGEAHTFYLNKIALKSEQVENGVYTVYSAEKNGTRRNFVRLTQVVTGAEQEGYLEITAVLSLSEQIVVGATEYLYDGCEVVIYQCSEII